MDYVQPFVVAVATAYFLWVAKCWWTTDRDGLAFQRKVFYVMMAITALGLSYSYGVLRGGNAVIDELGPTIEKIAAQVHAPPPDSALASPPSSTTKDVSTPKRHHLIEDVVPPGWALFYWFVVLIEICFAINMPDRRRVQAEPVSNGGQTP